MRGSGKKMQKTYIFGHLGQKGSFWTVFGQNGQNGGNFQKSAWNIFSHPQALTNCKVSEKSNEWFPRKSVAHVRTDGRMYERTYKQTQLLRSQRPVGRETKKQQAIYISDLCATSAVLGLLTDIICLQL